MRFVPFSPDHVWGLEIDTSHNDDARPLLRDNPEAFRKMTLHGWSLEDGGKVVACGGKVPRTDPEEWVWWVIFSPMPKRKLYWMTKTIKRLLDRECVDGTHVAHALDDTAVEWLMFLGFQPDGEEFGQHRMVRKSHE